MIPQCQKKADAIVWQWILVWLLSRHLDLRVEPNDSDWTSPVTLKTLPLEATVHYQFHPHANKTFKVLQRSGSVSSQITLELSPGKCFTVPMWMTDPVARDFTLSRSININFNLYLDILALLEGSCFAVETSSAVETTDEPRQL